MSSNNKEIVYSDFTKIVFSLSSKVDPGSPNPLKTTGEVNSLLDIQSGHYSLPDHCEFAAFSIGSNSQDTLGTGFIYPDATLYNSYEEALQILGLDYPGMRRIAYYIQLCQDIENVVQTRDGIARPFYKDDMIVKGGDGNWKVINGNLIISKKPLLL